MESERAIELADRVTIPTLVIIGTADEVTPPEGAKRFIEKVSSKDKELAEYPGAYHELFEDPEFSDRFYDKVFGFIRRYLRR